MLPVINIGPLAIQAPGLILLAGVWIGLSLAEKYSSGKGITSKHLHNLVFLIFAAGILGARIGFILQNLEIFLEDIRSIFSINPGLLDPMIGIVTAILAGFIYLQRNEISLWKMLDALTPFLMVLAIAISLSFLASGSYFGIPSSVPWSIELWETSRHPTQVYLTLAGILTLILLWPGRTYIHDLQPGIYFLISLAFMAFSIVMIEGFRANIHTLLTGLRTIQVAAWFTLATSLVLIYIRSKQTNS